MMDLVVRCDHCNQTFRDEEEVLPHCLNNHKAEVAEYPQPTFSMLCLACHGRELFRTWPDLLQHIEEKHGGKV